MIRRFVLAVVSLALCSALYAGHPLITDDAYTQGKGHWQFEFAGEYNRYSNGEERADNYLLPSFPVITYGFAENTDIVFSAAYDYTKTLGPVKDIEQRLFMGLEGKFQLLNYKDKFFFALKPGVFAPVVSDYEGAWGGNVDFSFYAIASYILGSFDFHLNTGYVTHGEDTHYTNSWHNSLAAEYNFYKGFKLVANSGFDYEEDMNSNFPFFSLIGLCYDYSDNLDLDIGYKRVHRIDGTDYSVLAGVTFRI